MLELAKSNQSNETIFGTNAKLNFSSLIILENTRIYKQLKEISSFTNEWETNIELVILSEPGLLYYNKSLLEEHKKNYVEYIKKARDSNIPLIHYVDNPKNFLFFKDLIEQYDIDVVINPKNQSLINEYLSDIEYVVVDTFFYPDKLIHYSNKFNKDIIVDTTFIDNFKELKPELVFNLSRKFDKVFIYSSCDNSLPTFSHENVRNVTDIDQSILESTYVFVASNQINNHEVMDRILFYAANSKVVYTPFNFIINNLFPSVILRENDIVPLPSAEVFLHINGNRNGVLYNHTIFNFLNNLYFKYTNKYIITKENLCDNDPSVIANIFLNSSTHQNSENDKDRGLIFDKGRTISFPYLYLKDENKYNLDIVNQLNVERERKGTKSKKVTSILSVIVPVYNNGMYLLYKCFHSLRRLSAFNKLEIILVNDGSTDSVTISVLEYLDHQYQNVKIINLSKSSGSASKPRNEAIKYVNTSYLTYLDPDNEVIDDGFSVLLEHMEEDTENLDMVVGNIVREDNIKRTPINFYNQIMKVNSNNPIIENTHKVLVDNNLTIQSIQGLVVKTKVFRDNDIKMVEGAAGQDTLFFQELFLNCQRVKVVNHNIHIYYAYVEGSVTNTITSKFFKKFLKLELERIRFLEKNQLIEVYMLKKFNHFVISWYLEKFKQVADADEKEKSILLIKEILGLYEDYNRFFSKEVALFIKENVIGFIGTYFTEQALNLNENIIKLTEKNLKEKISLYDINLIYVDNDIYEKDNEFIDNRLMLDTIKSLQSENIEVNIVKNSEKPILDRFEGLETLIFDSGSHIKDGEVSNKLPPLINYNSINPIKSSNSKDVLMLSIDGRNYSFHQKRLLSNKEINKEILFINKWSRKSIQKLIKKIRESKVIYINYSKGYDLILLDFLINSAILLDTYVVMDYRFQQQLSVSFNSFDDATNFNKIAGLIRNPIYRTKELATMQRKIFLENTSIGWNIKLNEERKLAFNKTIPKISVISSTNRRQNLDEFINRLSDQKLVDIELILLTHGYELTYEEQKYYQEKSNFKIKFITDTPDVSLGYCLNQCIDEAEYPVITKMDDDDYYLEYYLYDQWAALKYSKANLTGKFSIFVYLEGENMLIHRNKNEYYKYGNFIMGPTIMGTEETMRRHKFSDLFRGEDSDLLRRVISSGGKIYLNHPFEMVQFRAAQKDIHTWNVNDVNMIKSGDVIAYGNPVDTVKT